MIILFFVCKDSSYNNSVIHIFILYLAYFAAQTQTMRPEWVDTINWKV